MKMAASQLHRFLFFSLCFVAAGCSGSKTATVTGTVNYDGKPLPRGRITFYGDKNASSTADIEDGQYEAKKVPAGTAIKVTIATEYLKADVSMTGSGGPKERLRLLLEQTAVMKKEGKTIPAEFDEQVKELKKQEKRVEEQTKGYRPVDVKVTQADTTPLIFSITPGSQTLDPIELKKADPPTKPQR